ncbi:hypothetical protein BDV12DRAFT_160347 [Aspergillus spectabilis]
MLGHSRSGSRQSVVSKRPAPAISSPSRRRVTRSQSREVEETRGDFNAVNSSSRHDNPNKWGQSKALTPVVEETPFRTPRKTGTSHGAPYVPESPGDATNISISGTTFLEFNPEPDSELDSEKAPQPEIMIDALPDLEREGQRVLEFLAPSTATLKDIKKKVKLLSDPSSIQGRRFQRAAFGFAQVFEIFGKQTYIDAEGISRMISSTLAFRHAGLGDWSPDPTVQMANCVRFAQEILLTGSQENLQRQAICNVESLFPLPFTSGTVATGQATGPGESALENETLALALEIRTQSLILHLEDHQQDPGFSPRDAVTRYFLTGSSSDSPLRGFNLPNFGGADGTLPAQYRDIVQGRLNEILLEEDDDTGNFNLEVLKGVYHWDRFAMRAAEWIQKRTREIQSGLEKRISVEEVHTAFFDSKHPSLPNFLSGSEAELVGSQQDAPQQEITPQEGTPQKTTPQETVEQVNTEQDTTALPEVQRQQPESPSVHRGKERRRSSKPSYLNPPSMHSLKKRKERLQSGVEISHDRRESDVARPVFQSSAEQAAANHRQTSSALPAIPPEIPQSPEASATLLHDEPEITIGDDSQFAVGNDGSQVERSHSPPVPKSTVPWSQNATGTARRTESTDEMAYGLALWDSVKDGTSTRPSAGPMRAGTVNSRFIDHQPNAGRVSPIRDVDSQSAVARVEERASRKRARSTVETESDTDSRYFDYDNHSVDIRRRRAEKPQRPISKRPRVEVPQTQEDTNVDANDEDDVEKLPRTAPRRRHRGSISPQSSNRKPSSTGRRPWTEPEDERLLYLMGKYGPKWAKIEKENISHTVLPGQVRLEGRDQIAYKDRARNLKIKYYRYVLLTCL